MDSAMQWVNLIGAVFMIVAGVTGSILFVTGSLNKARIAALREDLTDARSRIDDQDKELERCNAREDTLEAKVAALETENAMLRDMVTSRAAVEDLIEQMTRHHREATAAWKKIIDAIEREANES